MMSFLRLLGLLSALSACTQTPPRAMAQLRCSSPIADRYWGEAIDDSVSADGRSGFSHFPKSPAINPALVSSLQGKYDFVVVSTNPRFRRDSIDYATLSLTPTPARYRDSPNPAIKTLYFGHSDVDLSRLGHVALAYSPSSTEPERPGVEVDYNSRDSTLDMTFGNAMSTGAHTMDAGVSFNVFRVDSLGFSGRWLDGGLPVAKPGHVTQGYFCAFRASS